MTIHFTCRQTRLTPALRQFAEEKLARLERYLDAESEVHMVLTVEKHRHQAEMMISSPRRHFTGTAITDDLYAAIGLVLDKLGKQLRRDKRRRTDRRRHEAHQLKGGEPGAGNGNARQPSFRRDTGRRKPMTPEEAAADLAAAERDFLVFRNTESGQMNVLYRHPDGHLALIED